MTEPTPDAFCMAPNDETTGTDDAPGSGLALHDRFPQFVSGRPRKARATTVLAWAIPLPRFGRFMVPPEALIHAENHR
jgi:hypothetical protein